MGTGKPQVTNGPWGEGDPRGRPDGAAIRASDAEREDALRVLADHYADGRLDRAEFDERADAAFAARTREQLRALFRDLPRPAAELVQQAGRAPRPTTRPPAPPIFILPLLLALGIVMALHGIPPFPLFALFILLARRQRGWDRN